MNIFVIAVVVSVVFLIIKFIEMRFVEKENKPLKLLIRDTLVVYMSVISGFFIFEQLNNGVASVSGGAPPVFVDNPEF